MADDLSREEVEHIAAEKAKEAAVRVMQDAAFQIRDEARRARETAGDYNRYFSREDIQRMLDEAAEKAEESIVKRLKNVGLDLTEPMEAAKLIAFLERMQTGSNSAFKWFFMSLFGAAAMWVFTAFPKMFGK